jgi:vacuolar-type H+-ATPase subunit I/STV1
MSNADPNSITVDTPPATVDPAIVAGETGDGFIANVQSPAISSRRTGNGQQPPPPAPTGNQAVQFTAADLEAAREQEKSKLYNRLNTMEEQFDRLASERQAALDAQKAAEQAAEETRKAKELEEMDLRTRLETMEASTQQRFQQLEEERQQAEAMLEQERRLSGLIQYRDKQLREYGAQIMPQLLDFVSGNSPEEIDAAIVAMVERTNSIVNDVQAVQNQNFSAMRGAGVTAPAGGPQEAVPQQQTFTAEQIRAMSPQVYAQHQAQLREAAKRQFYSGR